MLTCVPIHLPISTGRRWATPSPHCSTTPICGSRGKSLGKVPQAMPLGPTLSLFLPVVSCMVCVAWFYQPLGIDEHPDSLSAQLQGIGGMLMFGLGLTVILIMKLLSSLPLKQSSSSRSRWVASYWGGFAQHHTFSPSWCWSWHWCR